MDKTLRLCNFRLPSDLHDELKIVAERERRTLAQLFVFAIEHYLADRAPQPGPTPPPTIKPKAKRKAAA